jgi:hypothetical protein
MIFRDRPCRIDGTSAAELAHVVSGPVFNVVRLVEATPHQFVDSRLARRDAELRLTLAPLLHAGGFNAVASTGIFLSRLPVAAKIALTTAGMMHEVPHSPIPPGGSELATMWTSVAGASFMRSIW